VAVEQLRLTCASSGTHSAVAAAAAVAVSSASFVASTSFLAASAAASVSFLGRCCLLHPLTLAHLILVPVETEFQGLLRSPESSYDAGLVAGGFGTGVLAVFSLWQCLMGGVVEMKILNNNNSDVYTLGMCVYWLFIT
jgi:hypothetical protein